MLIFLFAVLAMTAQDETVEALTTAPETYPLAVKCTCAEGYAANSFVVEGLVIDAELTLAPDGRSTNARRATIFNVTRETEPGVKGRTKVWHVSDPDQCGVAFDYGKKYKVNLRKTEEGQLETDACLMKDLAK